MKFGDVLRIVGDEPVFETGLLLAGDVDPGDVRRQLSRWVDNGRLIQLRRGLYALAAPFRKAKPHPFVVANRLMPGSYVSCQSVLAHYGLIPEYVPMTTSVGPGRPHRWDTPLGSYSFRHLQEALISGFELKEVGDGLRAYVAKPEKALLDLVYLTPDADSDAYLEELRLQNLEQLSGDELTRLAGTIGKPKLQRAAEKILRLAEDEALSYETL
ncbi:MAG: hypothetical protein V3T72_14725 [Thermoanaerobaculia bacterium]